LLMSLIEFSPVDPPCIIVFVQQLNQLSAGTGPLIDDPDDVFFLQAGALQGSQARAGECREAV